MYLNGASALRARGGLSVIATLPHPSSETMGMEVMRSSSDACTPHGSVAERQLFCAYGTFLLLLVWDLPTGATSSRRIAWPGNAGRAITCLRHQPVQCFIHTVAPRSCPTSICFREAHLLQSCQYRARARGTTACRNGRGAGPISTGASHVLELRGKKCLRSHVDLLVHACTAAPSVRARHLVVSHLTDPKISGMPADVTPTADYRRGTFQERHRATKRP